MPFPLEIDLKGLYIHAIVGPNLICADIRSCFQLAGTDWFHPPPWLVVRDL